MTTAPDDLERELAAGVLRCNCIGFEFTRTGHDEFCPARHWPAVSAWARDREARRGQTMLEIGLEEIVAERDALRRGNATAVRALDEAVAELDALRAEIVRLNSPVTKHEYTELRAELEALRDLEDSAESCPHCCNHPALARARAVREGKP